MSDLTDQLDNLQSSVDDHEDRLSTTEGSTDDHESRLSTLETTVGDGTTIGQLDFPSTPDTVQRIRDVFPTGTFTLTNTSVVVTDANVSSNSIIMFARTNGGTVGNNIYATPGNGSITFTSITGTDNGTFAYVVFN